jgi:hypothetical protein
MLAAPVIVTRAVDKLLARFGSEVVEETVAVLENGPDWP